MKLLGNRVSRLCLWGVVTIAVLCYRTALAEVTTLTLPDKYADFAFVPQSGDLAAVSAEANEAVFFTAADLAAGKTEPHVKVRVGATPCSVFFKQYQDQQLFAVVCSQDSHMYLINAQAPFDLVAKVELSQSGVSLVTGSINPEDPFLYYCYGSGHDSMAGVVSLRDKKNHGQVFDHSMDCAFSASGEFAYRRGPWSPSGFESLGRTNPLSNEKPEFQRVFYDHHSTGAYLPDPFDRFTASGQAVYSRSLDKKEAELNFVPMAFFTSQPIVIGTDTGNRNPRSLARSNDNNGSVKLSAASYNTFTSSGDDITLSHKIADESSNLPRGVPSQADFKKLAKKARMFADDSRQQVLYAEANLLHFVPLADFNLPQEPFLQAKLEGAESILFNQANKLTLRLKDPQVQITIDDKPEGMEVSGETLTWTPAADQIGDAVILATLSAGDIQRTIRFDFNVAYPSIHLPFAPTGFSIDPQGERAVIWTGSTNRDPRLMQRDSKPEPLQIAVVQLKTGEVQATRLVADPIQSVLFAGEMIALTTAGARTPRCELLKLEDLTRAKTIIAGGPISQLKVVDDLLFIQTPNELEVYDLATFDRKKSFPITGGAQTPMVDQGIYSDGVLYGYDLKPRLILLPKALSALGGSVNTDLPNFVRKQNHQPDQVSFMPNSQGPRRVASAEVPGSGVTIHLDVRTQREQVSGAVHTWRTQNEVIITAEGGDQRQVLLRESTNASNPGNQNQSRPRLAVTSNNAYVVDGQKLYIWPILPAKADSPTEKFLVWEPQQSAFTLSSEATTTLSHQLNGAKPPVVYSMPFPYEGMSIDESSGVITVNNAAILAQAADNLENRYKVPRGLSAVAALRNEAPKMIEQATQLLGRRPTGVPVAIPVQLMASDANLASVRFTYFLIAEIPSGDFIARLKKRDEENSQQMPVANVEAAEPAPAEPSDPAAELEALKRKVTALEQQLQLLTQQMTLVLQKLQ